MKPSLALLPMLLLPLACGGEVAEPSTGEPGASGDEQATTWDLKLQAANKIVQDDLRDQTLTSFMVQAAEAGEGPVLLKALAMFRSVDAHDQAARSSAAALARLGHIAHARELAERIRSTELRDLALQQVSLGD